MLTVIVLGIVTWRQNHTGYSAALVEFGGSRAYMKNIINNERRWSSV
jgi:hypothetical protein